MKLESKQKVHKEEGPLPAQKPDYIQCPWVPVNEPAVTKPVFPNPCKPSEAEPDWTYVGK